MGQLEERVVQQVVMAKESMLSQELVLRRMQEEGEGELATPAESGTMVAADSSVSWQKPSTLVIIIGLSVTTALLIGLWLYRVTRRLANHAHSIKVLIMLGILQHPFFRHFSTS